MEKREQSEGRRQKDLWAKWDKRIRNALLFVYGSIGFFYELHIRSEPEIVILVAAGALMGVPLVLSASERKNDHEEQ